ncbi:MAG: hypothetical protein ABIH82_02440 [Candidatus Woesearchaeota archaeon]
MLSESEVKLIQENQVFVCLYAQGFHDNAIYEEGLAYAVQLGKPIYRLMQDELPVRPHTFLGVEIRHTEHFHGCVDSDSYSNALEKLLQRISNDFEEGQLVNSGSSGNSQH